MKLNASRGFHAIAPWARLHMFQEPTHQCTSHSEVAEQMHSGVVECSEKVKHSARVAKSGGFRRRANRRRANPISVVHAKTGDCKANEWCTCSRGPARKAFPLYPLPPPPTQEKRKAQFAAQQRTEAICKMSLRTGVCNLTSYSTMLRSLAVLATTFVCTGLYRTLPSERSERRERACVGPNHTLCPDNT